MNRISIVALSMALGFALPAYAQVIPVPMAPEQPSATHTEPQAVHANRQAASPNQQKPADAQKPQADNDQQQAAEECAKNPSCAYRFAKGKDRNRPYPYVEIVQIPVEIVPVPVPVQTSIAVIPQSMETYLLSRGESWIEIDDPIVCGDYVEDMVEERPNEPDDRGHIGKVVAMASDENGQNYARVDFGRGYIESIYTSDLSALRVWP